MTSRPRLENLPRPLGAAVPEVAELGQLHDEIHAESHAIGGSDQVFGSLTSWTPALTAATTNPNLGSTGTAVGHYAQNGQIVWFSFKVTFGGTGISAGSGQWYLSFPVPPSASILGDTALVPKIRYNFVTPGVRWGFAEWESATTLQLIVDVVSGTSIWAVGVTDTTFTPAAADWFSGSGMYAAA